MHVPVGTELVLTWCHGIGSFDAQFWCIQSVRYIKSLLYSTSLSKFIRPISPSGSLYIHLMPLSVTYTQSYTAILYPSGFGLSTPRLIYPCVFSWLLPIPFWNGYSWDGSLGQDSRLGAQAWKMGGCVEMSVGRCPTNTAVSFLGDPPWKDRFIPCDSGISSSRLPTSPNLHRWMWSQQDPFLECKPWAKCEEVSEISMGKTAFSCLWKGGMRVISPLLCFHDPMSHMARGVSPHLAEWGSYVGICKINASKERCLIYRLKIWLHYEDSKDWNWTWACSRLWSSMSPERLTRFGLHPSDCVANQYGRIERSPPGGRWFDPRCTRFTDITSWFNVPAAFETLGDLFLPSWAILKAWKLSHEE